ncbi:hypothetical protein TNCV_4887951 [Trichonephila clavipes]|nr:hypothetical protein TNCV_4887951 [Trichonephila clavipes]
MTNTVLEQWPGRLQTLTHCSSAMRPNQDSSLPVGSAPASSRSEEIKSTRRCDVGSEVVVLMVVASFYLRRTTSEWFHLKPSDVWKMVNDIESILVTLL